MSRHRHLALTAALLIGACSSPDAPADNHADEENRSIAAKGQIEAIVTPSGKPPSTSTSVYTLVGNGLAPGLTFGMAQSKAIGVATEAFGAPTGKSHNDECGEGPMDFVSFHDIQLGFQEGKFAGWSLGGRTPALRTASGIAIGTPRSALGKIAIDEQSSLGPEFSVGEVGGVLGEDGNVVALWAGLPCQFR